ARRLAAAAGAGRLSARRVAQHRRRAAPGDGLRLARPDRRGNAGAPGRPRRPHFRRPHLRADRPHHHRHDRNRLPLCRGRPPDRAADRESHRGPLGTAAPMSIATVTERSWARRTLNQLAWRLLPLAPFALVLLAWTAYWTIVQPPAATLPAV